MSRVRTALVLSIASAFIGVSACTLYGQSLLLPAVTEDAGTDAQVGSDAGDAGAFDAGNGCHLDDPPGKPAVDDGDAGDVDFVLALSAFRLVPGGTASVNHPSAPVPLDLDSVCTCPGAPSCKSPTSELNCDADGGGDDNAGDLWSTFAALAPTTFNDDGLNAGLRQGYNGLLIRIRSYNGGKNDTQVTVTGYLSPGTDGIQNGAPTPPKADGTDVWTIDPTSLIGGDSVDAGSGCEGNDKTCIPSIFDTNAYVTNGVLVTHLALPIVVGGIHARLNVELSDVVLVAPLVFDGSSYRIDEGRLGGRWLLSTFLTALQAEKDPADPSQGLCGSSASYQNVKMLACKARDVTERSLNDNTGATCDSMSITVSMSAVPAHLGPLFSTPPFNQYCDAGYSDSCQP